MYFCTRCGTSLPSDRPINFCPDCGSSASLLSELKTEAQFEHQTAPTALKDARQLGNNTAINNLVILGITKQLEVAEKVTDPKYYTNRSSFC
jgi:hypothetical protein